MNVLELTLDIAAAFDQVAQTEKGQQALDYASDCVSDWADLASDEIKRRMVKEVFGKLSHEDLVTIMLSGGGDYDIDFGKLAWEAVKKAREI